ncbi:hypothetical protein ABZZ17_00075 [Streptomyces sp. NPDC006512]|uniref:hypothetical protein n=1 Tax=Streptomyces sp. NPDC006512 TaxID=3154307 RepID=UPI0033AD53D7
MFAAYAAGRVASPKPVHSQAIGGMVSGIRNAVFNATGKRLTDLPIRLEALL